MDTKWWYLLIAEREAKGRNAIIVVKILFLTTNVQIVVLFIVKGNVGNMGRFAMDDEYNFSKDDLEKVGNGMEAGGAILGAVGALIAGIVALVSLFSKKDE